MFPLLLLLAQLTVHVHPFGFITRKSTVSVEVHVPRDSHNRSLALEVMGENYYSLSEKELEGEKAPVTHTFKIASGLPEGDYEIRAILVRWEDGKWKMIHQKGEDLHVN